MSGRSSRVSPYHHTSHTQHLTKLAQSARVFVFRESNRVYDDHTSDNIYSHMGKTNNSGVCVSHENKNRKIKGEEHVYDRNYGHFWLC